MSENDNDRMRELTYRLMRMAPPAPPFPEEPMTQLTPTPPTNRRPAVTWAFIAAAVVLVAIGVPAWLMRARQGEVVATTTASTSAPAPSTSMAPVTTSPVTSEPDTSSPTGTLDLSGLNWVRTDLGLQGVVGSDGRSVIDHSVPAVNYKYVAWDGGEGLVLLNEAGELRWVRPEADVDVPADVLDGEVATIDDVVLIDGRPVAALRSWTGETAWVDLESGDEVTGDPLRVDHFDDLGLQLGGQGRLVRIEFPENVDAERDETGALVWPFDLPELVVMRADGTELARIELGSQDQPWARLHDFDGRRVIASVEPLEPAFPPTTVYVIDLECADCTEVVELPGADTLDLVGILESSGPVIDDLDL